MEGHAVFSRCSQARPEAVIEELPIQLARGDVNRSLRDTSGSRPGEQTCCRPSFETQRPPVRKEDEHFARGRVLVGASTDGQRRREVDQRVHRQRAIGPSSQPVVGATGVHPAALREARGIALIRVSIPDDHRAVLALPSLAYAAAQSWRFDLDQRSVPNPPAGAIRKRRCSSDPGARRRVDASTAVERNGRGKPRRPIFIVRERIR
jgi:hypothetical protein